MKWFFALNQQGNEYEAYVEMLKVAVHTALKRTSLTPYFLYDGPENKLTSWLREKRVEIIHCRSFLYDRLRAIAKERRDPLYLSIGAGAFLRVEIPRITKMMGIRDRFILYTDLDVLFIDEVCDYLETLTPKFFAVAPEFSPIHPRRMNSGVMLMNLENLRKQDIFFRKFVSDNLESLVDKGWDQGAYKAFYGRKRMVRWFFGVKWNYLPPKYNWKPYWGDFSSAKIIHFHGPKPYQMDSLISPDTPKQLKPLIKLTKGKYFELCELWNSELKEALTV